MSRLRVNFNKATDPRLLPSQLRYRLYISQTEPLTTLQAIQDYGILSANALDVAQLTSDVIDPTFWYFNVTCSDLAGNTLVYGGGSILLSESSDDVTLRLTSPDTLTLQIGDSYQLAWLVNEADPSGYTVTFSSLNEAVATVNASGIITIPALASGYTTVTGQISGAQNAIDSVLVVVGDGIEFGPLTDSNQFTT